MRRIGHKLIFSAVATRHSAQAMPLFAQRQQALEAVAKRLRTQEGAGIDSLLQAHLYRPVSLQWLPAFSILAADFCP
jgi:hypothetical protein